jgi:hypothetical protein
VAEAGAALIRISGAQAYMTRAATVSDSSAVGSWMAGKRNWQPSVPWWPGGRGFLLQLRQTGAT